MIVVALVEYCLKSEARKDTTAPEARNLDYTKWGVVESIHLSFYDLVAADHRQGSLSLGFKTLAGS